MANIHAQSKAPCRICGSPNDEESPLYDGQEHKIPQEGDLTICLYCGAVSAIHKGKAVAATIEERGHLTLEALTAITVIKNGWVERHRKAKPSAPAHD